MKAYKYIPGKENILISACVFTAGNFLQRLFGLIFRKPLTGNEALLLKDCRSIHTHWMRYSLDILFLDEGGKIITIFKDMRPWNSTPFLDEAMYVMEFRSGFLKGAHISVGDRVIFQ